MGSSLMFRAPTLSGASCGHFKLASSIMCPSVNIQVRGLKTHVCRSAKKRFKVTANGLKRKGCGKRHINGGKSSKRLRRLSKSIDLKGANLANMKTLLRM